MDEVYFIQEGKNGPIKIGYSSKLQSRFTAMQSDNPRKLKILLKIGGGQNELDWVRTEFAELRISDTKWYVAGARLLKAIAAIREGNPAEFRQVTTGAREYKRSVDSSVKRSMGI